MVLFPLDAIVVVLFVEIFRLYFRIIFCNLCVAQTFSLRFLLLLLLPVHMQKEGGFLYFLFFVSHLCCLCFILKASRLCTCSVVLAREINFVLSFY